MTDDEFFERLRKDAQQLQYEPADTSTWTRLAARIRERVHAQPSVSHILARWLRPAGLSFGALALVAGLSVGWMETTVPENNTTIDAMAATPSEGEMLSVE